jgi:aspartate/methionine/tyrosine aminotransferase
MASMDNFEFAHRHRKQVVWMSQNTNMIPLSPKINEAIRQSVNEREYNLYGFKKGVFGLCDAIKADLKMEDWDIHLTNGGIEGLYMANRAFLQPGDEVIATDPSFMPIHDQVLMAGAKVKELDIYHEPWKLTPEHVSDAATPKSKMLLIIDPNNPLGTAYSRQEIRALCEVAEDRGMFVIDDITYRDFNPLHTLASDFYPEKTIVSYSFSKGCGMAGMRIGAVLAPPDVMKAIKKFDTNVLGVNVLAQRGALAALETKKRWLPKLRQICRKNQDVIKSAVSKVRGAYLPVFPSLANMFCVDIRETGVNPEKVEAMLLQDHYIHTRAGQYLSKRFGPRFVRVSFSIPTEQCRKFAAAFPKVMKALSK